MGPGGNGARSHGSSGGAGCVRGGGGGCKCGKGGVCGGGGWGWGWSHDARSKGPMTSTGGGAGCVRGGWGLRVGVEQLMKNGIRSHGCMKSMAGCVGGLGKGMYAEREGRMGGERVRGWWG